MILVAVYVCTLAIQGATARMMFSMGRDRRLPFGGSGVTSTRRSRRRPTRSIAVGVLAAHPVLGDPPGGLTRHRRDRDDLHRATSCATSASSSRGAAAGRTRAPGSTSGSWGTIINILALVWGGLMIINFALWTDTGLFGVYGIDLRQHVVEPVHQPRSSRSVGRSTSCRPSRSSRSSWASCSSWAASTTCRQRGKLDKVQVEADAATGEAVIG